MSSRPASTMPTVTPTTMPDELFASELEGIEVAALLELLRGTDEKTSVLVLPELLCEEDERFPVVVVGEVLSRSAMYTTGPSATIK